MVISNKVAPLCILPCGKLICYKSGKILIINERKIERSFIVFYNKKERLLGRCRYIYRLLRLGIRAAIALNDEQIILSIGNILFELDLNTEELSNGYLCGKGIRPLVFSLVKGINGLDDGIYFGGYLGNKNKKPVNIYKRCAVDKWEVMYTFPQGAINHIHNIVPDQYRNCLWVLTGDFGEAAAIWKVSDFFNKVELFACNNQTYRGCVMFVLPEGLLYATDSSFAYNYIYLMNPDTSEVTEIMPIGGSCIYGCQWKNKYVFSSTVEGDGRNTSMFEFYFSRKRGNGIKDEYVHLYSGNLYEGFNEIHKEKKDFMPIYTFQFGVFRFPYGDNKGDILYFQPIATKKFDLCLMGLTSE